MGPIAGGKQCRDSDRMYGRVVPARGRPPARLVKEGVQPAVISAVE
jgi:hypothetical protein